MHGQQKLFGTLLGHWRYDPLISLHYFRFIIATVERREASVPRVCETRLVRASEARLRLSALRPPLFGSGANG